MGSFLRAFAVWLLMMTAESIHGVLRTALLAPSIGDFRARQMSVATGSLLILALAWLTIRWIDPKSRGQALMIGAFWVVLTVLFEIGLGRLVMGLSWQRIFEDYDLPHGGFMAVGLAVMFLSPLVAACLRGRPRP